MGTQSKPLPFAGSLLPYATVIGILTSLTPSFTTAETVKFNRDIRPILANHCFQCHGPSDKDRQADLRLDQQGGISAAFLSNNLVESEAWQRIISEDPDSIMPPPSAHHEMKTRGH